MKEPCDIKLEILEPALETLTADRLWRIRLAIGALAIRLGLARALVVTAPDDFPNCLVSFWDKNFGAHICYHLNVETAKLVKPKDLCLPEPTHQPEDPVDVPCTNGKSCNC